MISQTSARAWRLGHRLFLSPSLNYLEDRAGALNPSCLPGVARLMPLPTLHHYFFHLIWGWLAISRLLDSRNRKTEPLRCAALSAEAARLSPGLLREARGVFSLGSSTKVSRSLPTLQKRISKQVRVKQSEASLLSRDKESARFTLKQDVWRA